MRKGALIPFIPYIIVSVLHVVLDHTGRPFGLSSYSTKQLLIATLALGAIWSAASIRPWPKKAMILLLIAMLGSWIGDGAGLLFPGQPTLPTMILFFGIAHVAYILLFWRAPDMRDVRRVPWWALVYAAWWIVTILIVGPHAGGLFIPLAVYGLVLGGTAALSTRLGPLVATGGAFFLVSDTLIALREFLDVPSLLSDFVMPTYELGQGLIVFGIVAVLRRSAEERPGLSPADETASRAR